jgi:hypothetical protein
MLLSRLLLLAIALAASVSAHTRRLPRGFTPALYCAACRSVALEIRIAHDAASASETVDSGSFRLSESGKQLARTRVPLRRSELHAIASLDAACADIAARYLLPLDSVRRGPFVPKTLRDERGLADANFTDDCVPVRALRALCANIVDEYEDELKSRLKAGDLQPEEWSLELCGPEGIVAACDKDSEPGDVETALRTAMEQLDAYRSHQAFLSAEKNAKERAANTSTADSAAMASSGDSRTESHDSANANTEDVSTPVNGLEHSSIESNARSGASNLEMTTKDEL